LPYARHFLGRCYIHNPDEAIIEFQKAIILKPDYVFAYFDLAKAYLLKQDFNQSLAYALMSIKLNKKGLMGYVYAIHSHAELGQIEEAGRLLQKSLKLFPDDPNLKYLKGFVKTK